MVILSLLCLAVGVALSDVASKRLLQQAAFETTAGCLLISGLVLVGTGLPLFR